MNALKINYKVIPLYIGKDNKFYYTNNLMNLESYKNIEDIVKSKNEVAICRKNKKCYLKTKGMKRNIIFDLAFPVVHGKGMEDGTLLSYLKFKKIPVIADSLPFFSLAQNKCLSKRVLDSLEINNSKFMEIRENDEVKDVIYPVIVKPNNLGSSIGIVKANNLEQLQRGLNEAFKYDKKVIVEEFLENCNEYNISVTEKNGEVITSNIEEIIKSGEFFNYEQKYEEDNKVKGMLSSKRIFPARISDDLKIEIEEIAKKIYKAFEAKGVIRIDFLYNGKLFVNEINSIPGSYSFYLWKGKMDFVELLDNVIENSKREIFKDNKLIKVIDKLSIFDSYDKCCTKGGKVG